MSINMFCDIMLNADTVLSVANLPIFHELTLVLV